MPKQEKEKLARPKITIIPGRGVAQTINYLLEDRDDSIGGEIKVAARLEYLKARIVRAHFGDEYE